MENKKCVKCGIIKILSMFYKGDSKCKECRKNLVIEYRRNNIEKIRSYDIARGKLPHRKEKAVINTRNRRKDPDGYMAAHIAVSKALKNGILKRMPCMMCGRTDLVHAHHDNYLKPLDVMWLCVIHHKSRHSFLDYINEDIF